LDAGEYLVVWCDDNLTQSGVHTNFKLSKSGEYIAIVDTNGITVIDSLSFGAQKTDTSYGRYPDAAASWQFMLPTPGSANVVTSIKEEYIPIEFSLSQNYPNPFNPTTKIEYSIPKAGLVRLKVYNLLGREVAAIVNQSQAAGKYSVNFNAGLLSSGLYFYKIQVGNYFLIKKMLLMK
jgi:hypothetical protein